MAVQKSKVNKSRRLNKFSRLLFIKKKPVFKPIDLKSTYISSNFGWIYLNRVRNKKKKDKKKKIRKKRYGFIFRKKLFKFNIIFRKKRKFDFSF